VKRLARVAPMAFLLEVLVLVQAKLLGFSRYVAEHDFRCFYTGGLMMQRGAGSELGSVSAQLAWQSRVWPELAGPERLNVWLNPPFVAVALSPLAFLGPEHAFVVWATFLALLLSVFLALALDALPEESRARASVLLVSFPPVAVALLQGQFTYILALGLLLAWRELDRGRDVRAGIWLALCLVKPQFVIVPSLYFLRMKRLRPLLGLALAGSVLGLVSLVAVGPAGCVAYVKLLRAAGSVGIASSHREVMQSWMGLLAWTTGEQDSRLIRVAFYLGVAAAVVLLLAKPGKTLERAWAHVVTAAVFTSPHLHFHDVTLLLVGAVLVWRRPELSRARKIAVAGYVLAWLDAVGSSALGVRLVPLMPLVEIAAMATLAEW